MKPLYGFLAFLLVVGLGYYAFFYHPCEEPSDIQVAIAGLQCTIEILNKPVEQLREEICGSVGKPADCELTEDDKTVALELINRQAFACAKKKLEAENFCTDKVDAIMKSKGL